LIDGDPGPDQEAITREQERTASGGPCSSNHDPVGFRIRRRPRIGWKFAVVAPVANAAEIADIVTLLLLPVFRAPKDISAHTYPFKTR